RISTSVPGALKIYFRFFWAVGNWLALDRSAWYPVGVTRKALGLVLAVSTAVSWAGSLCAASAAPSHACCAGAPAPSSAPGDAPACCREPQAPPSAVAADVKVPGPALAGGAVLVFELPSVGLRIEPREPSWAPQAPPGTRSGLSPPSSAA
ncbi:MAG: hypothetical protein AAB036_06340, partial [Elusimicrobiota bacterium]